MAQSPIADVDPTTITESRTANSSEPRQQSSSPFLASQNLNDHQDQHNPSVAPQTLSSLHHQQQPTHFWNHTDGNASINPHNHVPPTQPAFPANGPPRLHAQGNHQRGPTPNGLGPGMINGMVTNHGVGMQQRASSWSGPHQHMQDSRTQLFVSNLPFRVRWQDLKDLMRKCGTVLRADVALTPADGRSRGFGVVLFSRYEDALKAIEVYHGYSWQTRILDVRIDSQDPRGELALAEATRQTALQQQAERYQLAIQQHQQHYGQSQGALVPPPPPPPHLPSVHNGSSPLLTSGAGSSATSSAANVTLPQQAGNNVSGSSPAPSPRPGSASLSPRLGKAEDSDVPKVDGLSRSPALHQDGLIPPPPPPPLPPSATNVSGPFGFGPQGMMHGGLVNYYQQQHMNPNVRHGMLPGAGGNPQFGPSPVPAQYVGRHLFVGNLPFNCQWQELKDLMRQCGSVLRADIAQGPDGRSRGFGSVLFATAQDAERAVQQLNNYEFNGRVLKVHFDKFSSASIPPPNAPPPLMQHHSSPAGPIQNGGASDAYNLLLGPSYDPSRDLRDPRQIGMHMQHQQPGFSSFGHSAGVVAGLGQRPGSTQGEFMPQAPLQDRFPDRAAMRLRDESAFGGERGQVGIGGGGAGGRIVIGGGGGHGSGADATAGGSIMGVLHQAGALQSQVTSADAEADPNQASLETNGRASESESDKMQDSGVLSKDGYLERGWADPEPEPEVKAEAPPAPSSSASSTTVSTAAVGPPQGLRLHPSRISMPPPSFPFTPGGGPLSPMTGGRLPPMTPSMPAFTLGAFPPTPPPMHPQGMFSPGLGPFSPQVGSPYFGPPMDYMNGSLNAAPGAPVHRQPQSDFEHMYNHPGQHYHDASAVQYEYSNPDQRPSSVRSADDDKTPPAHSTHGASNSHRSTDEPSYFPPVSASSNGSGDNSNYFTVGSGSQHTTAITKVTNSQAQPVGAGVASEGHTSSAPLSPSITDNRPDLTRHSHSAESAAAAAAATTSTQVPGRDQTPSTDSVSSPPSESLASLKLDVASKSGAGWGSMLALNESAHAVVGPPRRKSFIPGLNSSSSTSQTNSLHDIRRRFEGDGIGIGPSASSTLNSSLIGLRGNGNGFGNGNASSLSGSSGLLGNVVNSDLMGRRASFEDQSLAQRARPKFGSSIWGV